MTLKYYLYAPTIVFTALLPLLLIGCGGSSTNSSNDVVGGSGSGFSVTGKIALVGGTPVIGTAVTLHKTSYKIYSTSINGSVFYGTRAANGVESVKIDSAGMSASTNNQGKYSFTGMSSGSYTIKAAPSALYVFNWFKVPSRSDIGVITITKSGMVYIYNPEENDNNTLSTDGTIIYNIGVPYAITDDTSNGQDFIASNPGGIGIQF